MVFILGNGNVIAGEIHDLLGLSLVMTYRRHEYLWKYTLQCDHNNCIISYGIALLASERGLYLARHLSTL